MTTYAFTARREADVIANKFDAKLDVVLFALFVVGVFAYSLFYPALNWPDEPYKIAQLFHGDNFYLILLRILSAADCHVGHIRNHVGYGSGAFDVELTREAVCYYQLKVANALMMIASAGIGLLIARRPEARRIYLLSLIWPACLFYGTGINQQAAFQTLTLAFASHAVVSRQFFRTLLFSLPLIFLDRSAVTVFVFFFGAGVLQLSRRLGLRATILITISAPFIAALMVPIVLPLIAPLFSSDDLVGLDNVLSQKKDSPIFSLALFFISFVYLGGTSTVFGIGLDYAFVLVMFGVLLWRVRHNLDIWVYLSAFMATYLFIVTVVPTIQSFRYHPYVLPVILHIMLPSIKQRNWYVVYCVVMALVYLNLGVLIANV